MTDSAAFVEPLAPRLVGWPSLMRARAACTTWRSIASFEAQHRLEQEIARPELFTLLMRTEWSRAFALQAAHRVVDRPEHSRGMLLARAAAVGDIEWVHVLSGAGFTCASSVDEAIEAALIARHSQVAEWLVKRFPDLRLDANETLRLAVQFPRGEQVVWALASHPHGPGPELLVWSLCLTGRLRWAARLINRAGLERRVLGDVFRSAVAHSPQLAARMIDECGLAAHEVDLERTCVTMCVHNNLEALQRIVGRLGLTHAHVRAIDAQLTKVGCRTSAAKWLRRRCGLESASSDAASSDAKSAMIYFALGCFLGLVVLLALFSADQRTR